MLKLKDKMPKFNLPDQDGKMISDKNFPGKKVLMYFYPKDDTPGCTTEACGFRDIRYVLQDAGVEIVGISKDSVKSHKKFTEKYDLNFRLLSDESLEMIKSFEAYGTKKFMGKVYDGVFRISYLFDEKGKVEKVYGEVNTKTHADEVKSDIIN